MADPFDTAALRRSVLDSWASSPARFREDANAEEALATGGYADRLLVELAANAVDAAREAGLPGRVRFTLTTTGLVAELRAANVGAPLTAAGVSGLASLRASAKRGRGATVGHFGVGFTAVLAVSDAPEVWSSSGGVRFSRHDTARAIAALGIDGLDQEASARDGQVPVLRLPWPIEIPAGRADPVPDGFETQVRLPVRAGLAPGLAALLRDVGDELLWALPGLTILEIELPGAPLRVVERVEGEDGATVILDGAGSTRYRAVTGRGIIPAGMLADRPIEERDRDQWQLTWVLPEGDLARPSIVGFELAAPADPAFLGAPTPTDEPLSLPARLVGTFPVDDTRRRLAPGALTEYLLGQAAAEYVELFAATPAELQLALVPSAGFPLGPVDAELRNQIIRRLSVAPVALTVRGESIPPSRACVIVGVSEAAARLLGRAVPGLLPPPESVAQTEALRVLGVVTMPVADAVTALAGIDGSPAFWHDVYQALSDQSSEDLANLPVPLSGGGRRIGPTGCLLPGPDSADDDILARASALAPDLRLVHPDAAHPLLSRLGALPADAPALLADPALGQLFHDFRQDLEDSDPDPDDLRELARLALDLAGSPGAGQLDDVVLTDAEGEAWPAGELLAPGAPLASVLAPDADLPMVGAEWLDHPMEVLARLGVRTGLKIVPVENSDADLPDLPDWWADVVGDGLPPEAFDAIADLDLVDDEKWPEFLALLEADPAALRALTSGPQPSYTRWWLSQFALLAGHRPGHWRTPGAVDLSGLYDELPVAVDPVVATAIGVLTSGADALEADPTELVRRLADPLRTVLPGAVPGLTRLVVDALQRDPDIALPAAVRTLSGVVAEADEAVVLDLPWFAQIVDAATLVAGGDDPARVGHAFDLDLASEVVTVTVLGPASEPDPAQLAAAGRAALDLGVELAAVFPAGTLRTVQDLSVRVKQEASQRVSWWSMPGGLVTDGSPEGIGRAVAWAAHHWADRHRAVASARGELVGFAENGLA